MLRPTESAKPLHCFPECVRGRARINNAVPSRSARMTGVAAVVAVIASAVAVAFCPTPSSAQTKLDTGRTSYGTRVLRTIAPGPNDTWELNRIRDAEIDRFGQLWALEDTELKVRVFSADGRLLHVLGGEGSGPGEFRGFRWIQALGDTMWVLDPRQPRLTGYSIRTGKIVTGSRRVLANPSVFALSPVGSFMRDFSDPNGAATESKPLTITFMHAAQTDGHSIKLADMIRRQPLYSARIYVATEAAPPPAPKQNGSGLQLTQLFENFALTKVSAGGRSLVLIDRALSGATSKNPLSFSKPITVFRVVEIGIKGDTIAKREFETPTVPLLKSQVDAVVDSLSHAAAFVSGKNWLASVSDIRQALYVPKTWPAVMGFHTGIDGSLWLLQPQPPSRLAKYWRISADGRVLPAVSLNAGLRILRVSANRVWVVKEDGDGLPTIQIHDVVPLKQ